MKYVEIATIVKNIFERGYLDEEHSIKVISSNQADKTILAYIETLHDNLDTSLYKLNYNHRFILGRLQRYSQSATVWISDDLNTCWSRYVATKELAHLIIDRNSQSLTTNMSMIIDWIISGFDTNINDALESEHLAALLAVELLIPYNASQKLLKNSKINDFELANQFKVPKKIIQTLRTEQVIKNRDGAFKDL